MLGSPASRSATSPARGAWHRGLLFGAYACGLVPGLIMAGRLSDDHGRWSLVLPASVLAIAASATLAFGGLGFGVLLAGRRPASLPRSLRRRWWCRTWFMRL